MPWYRNLPRWLRDDPLKALAIEEISLKAEFQHVRSGKCLGQPYLDQRRCVISCHSLETYLGPISCFNRCFRQRAAAKHTGESGGKRDRHNDPRDLLEAHPALQKVAVIPDLDVLDCRKMRLVQSWFVVYCHVILRTLLLP